MTLLILKISGLPLLMFTQYSNMETSGTKMSVHILCKIVNGTILIIEVVFYMFSFNELIVSPPLKS